MSDIERMRGPLFDKRIRLLFDGLGFDVNEAKKYDLDYFIQFNSKKFEERGIFLIEPRFFPKCKCAVECTTSRSSLNEDAKNFSKKLKKCDKSIKGKIICIDYGIPLSDLLEHLKNNIYVWDTKRLFFYSKKIFLATEMNKESDIIEEKEINDNTTFLISRKRNSPPNYNTEFKIIIFHDSNEPADDKDIENILKSVKENIRTDKRINLPSLLDIEFHTTGGIVIENPSKILKQVLAKIDKEENKNSPTRIILASKTPEEIFYDYLVAPWYHIIPIPFRVL